MEITNKSLKGINLLRNISGISWGAHPITLLNIFKAVVRAQFDYSATETRLQKLDTLQYRVIT